MFRIYQGSSAGLGDIGMFVQRLVLGRQVSVARAPSDPQSKTSLILSQVTNIPALALKRASTPLTLLPHRSRLAYVGRKHWLWPYRSSSFILQHRPERFFFSLMGWDVSSGRFRTRMQVDDQARSTREQKLPIILSGIR